MAFLMSRPDGQLWVRLGNPDHVDRDRAEVGLLQAINDLHPFVSAFGPAHKVTERGPGPPDMLVLASLGGTPVLTVPMGLLPDLPAGVLFFGPAWSEPALLRCGYAYEQRTHHRT